MADNPVPLRGAALVQLAVSLAAERDLYLVLQVDRDVTNSELKKAYRKRALTLHPDRFSHGEFSSSAEDVLHATRCFQILSRAHKILSDPESRRVYDECGEVPDDLMNAQVDDSVDWAQYWRLLFKPVTKQDVENYAERYRGSDEEKTDLRKLYEQFDGDFALILDNLPLAEFEDEERLEALVREMFENGELREETAFVKETSTTAKKKRKQRALRERREAEAAENDAGPSDLAAAIQARQQDRARGFESCLDGLMAKYCSGGNSSRKKKKKKKTESSNAPQKKKARRKNNSTK